MSEPSAVGVPSSLAEVDASWLGRVLGRRVDSVHASAVGTGQIGTCYRLELTGDGVPDRLLLKLPVADPATRTMLAGVYRSEVQFYDRIAATVAVRAPRCFHAAMLDDDSGDFVLLMEDLAPLEQGDQVAGCSIEQARDAVRNLAGLHGPRWCDPTLLDLPGLSVNGPDDAALLAELYGPATELFLDELGDLVSAQDRDTLRACVPLAERWALGRAERFALVHGDYRLDNLMFPPDGDGDGNGAVGRVAAVDWQTLSLALPARDLAYFLGTGLSVPDRREAELSLVASYSAALVEHGVADADYPAELCWEDYRYAMVQGPLVAVFGCAYGTRTERGDRMFAAMVARSCQAIRDLGTLDLVE